MTELSEREVLDCIAENFRLAAENADRLAVIKARGPVYKALRENLKLLEGACRQAGYYRDNAMWMKLGLDCHKCHEMAGEWLRGIKRPGVKARIPIAQSQINPLFKKLAETLRKLAADAERLRDRPHGRVGPILPAAYMRPAPVNGMRYTPGGLLIPATLQ